LGLRNEIKLVFSSIVIAVLLGFTQVPNSIQSAYAAGCAEEDVQHWNQISFVYGADDLVSDTEPTLDESTRYDIWIQRDGNGITKTVQVVVDHLTDLGYVDSNGNPPQPQFFFIPFDLVQYSSFCNNLGLAQVVGGVLLNPDATTLIIAYGIANAIWVVPSVAGIGIAVYLVKRRF